MNQYNENKEEDRTKFLGYITPIITDYAKEYNEKLKTLNDYRINSYLELVESLNTHLFQLSSLLDLVQLLLIL
ncbi:MAG TPA: hypothetical protein VKA95_17330 [Nitrososphaeraceae archaeon]|nr:hypothetical protein [Nitrososphaeraceae archaeon]